MFFIRLYLVILVIVLFADISTDTCLKGRTMEVKRENVWVSHSVIHQKKDRASITNDAEQRQIRSQAENEDKEPEFVFSKRLDEEAAAYKEGNATFKDDYESLEKAIEIVRALAVRLREKINKLKNPTVNINSDHPIDNTATTKVHTGIKAYHNESTNDEVEVLEQQLAEYERQEAELKLKMLNMIIEERKRLERLN